MANKREFKRYAEALASAVCNELAVVYTYNDNAEEQQKIEKEIVDLLAAGKKSAARANTRFDKHLKSFNGDVKAYRKAKREFFKSLYKNLNDGLKDRVQEGIKVLNASEKTA